MSTFSCYLASLVIDSALAAYQTIEAEVGSVLLRFYDRSTADEFQASKVRAVVQRIEQTIQAVETKIAKFTEKKP